MKLKNKFLSVFLIIFLVLSFVSTASAQPQGGLDMIVEGVQGALDSQNIDIQVNSFTGVILWVVLPIGLFYGIYRFITHHGLIIAKENFEDNIGTGNSDLTEIGDMTSRLISLGLGVYTYSFVGGSIGLLILLSSLAGLLFFIFILVSSNTAFFSGFPLIGDNQGGNPFGGPGEQSESGSGGTGDTIKHVGEQIQAASEGIEKISGELDKIRGDQNTTEEEEQSGNGDPSRLAEEIYMEVNEITEVTEEVERIERNFEQILNELEEAEADIQSQEQSVEQRLEQIDGFEQNALKELKNLIQFLKKFQNNQSSGDLEGSLQEEVGLLENQHEQLQQFREAIEQVAQVDNEVNAVERELNQLKTEISSIIEGVKELKVEIEEQGDIENVAEQLARKYSDKEDFQKIEEEEEQLAKDAKEVERLIKKAKNLKSRIEQEIEKIKQEDSEKQTEVKQILEEVNNLETEEGELQTAEQIIENIKNTRNLSIGVENGTYDQWTNDVKNIMQEIEAIKSEAQKLTDKVEG